MKPVVGAFLVLLVLLGAGPCLAQEPQPVVFAGPPKLVGPRLLALPLTLVDRYGNHLELPQDSLTHPLWDQTPVPWFRLGYQPGPRGLQMARCQGSCLKAGEELEKMGGIRALAKIAALGVTKVEAKRVKIHDFSDGRLAVSLPKALLPRFLAEFSGQLPPDWPRGQETRTAWVTGNKAALLAMEHRFGQAGGLFLPAPQNPSNRGLEALWQRPYRSIEVSGSLLASAEFRTALARSLPADHPLRRTPSPGQTVLEGASRNREFPRELKVQSPGLYPELAQFQRALAAQGQTLGFVLAHPALASSAPEKLPAESPAPAPRRDRLVFSSLGAALYLDAVLVTPQEQQHQYEPEQLDLWFADLKTNVRTPGKALPQVEQALERTRPEGENWLLLPLPEGPVNGPLTLRLELADQKRSFVLQLRPPDLEYLGSKEGPLAQEEKAFAAKFQAQDWPGAWAVAQPIVAALDQDQGSRAEPVAAAWRLRAARVKQELGDSKGAQADLVRLTQDYPLTEPAQEGWGLLLSSRLALTE